LVRDGVMAADCVMYAIDGGAVRMMKYLLNHEVIYGAICERWNEHKPRIWKDFLEYIDILNVGVKNWNRMKKVIEDVWEKFCEERRGC